MNKDSIIYVAGHRGLVGSALVRELKGLGFENIITVDHKHLDLTRETEVKHFFSVVQPEYVFLCAAKVGGIKAHAIDQSTFFLENSLIQQNVICNSARYGCKKLVFLGSSCIYPRLCPQPIKEEYLLTGPLEPSNEPYALAKISGVRLCKWMKESGKLDAVSVMPCNLYGPGDSKDPEKAHIIPGMLARMHAAKVLHEPTFTVWGDGTAKREFLFSQDLARALITVADNYKGVEHINTGSGDERTVRELAEVMKKIIRYDGELVFDASQPTGTPRKVMDNSKIRALGWAPKIELEWGLELTYEDFLCRV